jgi:hypothetical protein
LVYPEAFFADSTKFDLALLINVLNIMPVPSERLLVIQECYKKLKQNGHLLWYSQYGDADYKRRCTAGVRLGDGYYVGRRRRYKTFYREFGHAEMDSTMLANGFRFVRSYLVPHNHVRLYQKSSINPFGAALTKANLERELPRDSSIQDPPKGQLLPKRVVRRKGVSEVRPDPPSLSLEANYASRLSNLRPGHQHAGEYHALVMAIFKYLFVPERIRRMNKEVPIFEGRKRIDIMCRTGEKGFFATLQREYGVRSPYIIVECKNYERDIENPEFDQLLGRLTTPRGQFGMIICRAIKKCKTVIRRCKDAHSGELKLYVIVLTDVDLKELLQARQSRDWQAMDNYLDRKMDDILT